MEDKKKSGEGQGGHTKEKGVPPSQTTTDRWSRWRERGRTHAMYSKDG